MATTTYLSNPTLTIAIGEAAAVDYGDQCTALTLTSLKESQDITAFGDVARKYRAGLANNECAVTLFGSFGTTEVEALNAAVGATCTIVTSPTSGAAAADNPIYTLTGAYLESMPVITGSVGEIATVDLTFTGGVLTRNVTPPE
jgi:hypothetical protein